MLQAPVKSSEGFSSRYPGLQMHTQIMLVAVILTTI